MCSYDWLSNTGPCHSSEVSTYLLVGCAGRLQTSPWKTMAEQKLRGPLPSCRQLASLEKVGGAKQGLPSTSSHAH